MKRFEHAGGECGGHPREPTELPWLETRVSLHEIVGKGGDDDPWSNQQQHLEINFPVTEITVQSVNPRLVAVVHPVHQDEWDGIEQETLELDG